MSHTKQARKPRGSHIVKLIVGLLAIAAAALLFLNRQHILDQISIWQHQPSYEIVALAERSGMSAKGEFYFYASRPQLLDATAFNETCERKEEATAILGCYNGQYIYIYNINDKKLDGVREVTAAHEMLHAAYVRLSDSERQRVDRLIEAEYNNLRDDEELAERLAFYERTEPGERHNELHSIIGTEVKEIGDELEKYYRKYFDDRSKTVALYQRYANVFIDLQQRGEELSQQLTRLGDEIEAESTQYNTNVSQFNRDVTDFNQRAERGDFSTQAAFDSERSQLVGRGEALEVQRRAIDIKVARYETLRAELAGIATETQNLNQSIDSSLVPVPSL